MTEQKLSDKKHLSVFLKCLSTGLAVAGIALIVLWAGCVSGRKVDKSLTPGEKVFRNNCQSCHRLPDPESKTAKEWKKVLKVHIPDRIEMDDSERKVLFRFLTSF